MRHWLDNRSRCLVSVDETESSADFDQSENFKNVSTRSRECREDGVAPVDVKRRCLRWSVVSPKDRVNSTPKALLLNERDRAIRTVTRLLPGRKSVHVAVLARQRMSAGSVQDLRLLPRLTKLSRATIPSCAGNLFLALMSAMATCSLISHGTVISQA